MGLFSKKTTEATEETKVAAPKKTASKGKAVAKAPKVAKAKKEAKAPADVSATTSAALGQVILRPRITEKATMKAETENVYVFEVAKDANKTTIRQAVSALYKVNPTRIAIAYNPSKKVFRRGHRGVVSGVKKAYVHVKKGDKIEIV